MSKTFILSIIAGLINQNIDVVKAFVVETLPMLQTILPAPWNSLAFQIGSILTAWLGAIVTTWARNKGVSDRSMANPFTGKKTKVWNSK